MPRGNQTGPMGQGPKTGRAAGYCSGSAAPGFASSPGGGGMRGRGHGGGGRGRGGGGRGQRNMFHATGLTGQQRAAAAEAVPTPPPATITEVTEEQELETLKAQANEAATMLDQIRQRIDEIAAAKSQDSTVE